MKNKYGENSSILKHIDKLENQNFEIMKHPNESDESFIHRCKIYYHEKSILELKTANKELIDFLISAAIHQKSFSDACNVLTEGDVTQFRVWQDDMNQEIRSLLEKHTGKSIEELTG